MILASRISRERGHCTVADCERIESLLTAFGLQTRPPKVDRQKMLAAILTDKKSRDGTISFICNRGIGNFVVEQLLPEELLTLSGLEVYS
jgi:3-dehydroquinate synthetase